MRHIQRLADSGDFEGFNAVIGALSDAYDATAIAVITRDAEFRFMVTERCQEAWTRKHAKR
jgi:hypothetical protein